MDGNDEQKGDIETDRTARVYDVIFYESLGAGPIMSAPAIPKSLRANKTRRQKARERVEETR